MVRLVDIAQVLRHRDPAVLDGGRRVAGGELAGFFSPITVAELWRGVRPREEHQLAAMFTSLSCLPVDEAVGQRAGDYLRQFARSHGVQLGDALIAATASTHGIALWTRNRKHYPMRDVQFFRP